MNDTFGPNGSDSSPSADLQSSLESRLVDALDSTGCELYALTWKHVDIGSEPPILQRQALVRRTSGKGSSSEPSGWGTPRCGGDRGPTEGDPRGRIENHAQLAGWPTAISNDATGSPNYTGGYLKMLGAARLAGWPTPTSSESKHGDTFRRGNQTLKGAARASAQVVSTVASTSVPKQVQLVADGQMPSGSDAPTGSRGQLNPDHSRWLMGIPEEWRSCAPTETASFLTRRRDSLRRSPTLFPNYDEET